MSIKRCALLSGAPLSGDYCCIIIIIIIIITISIIIITSI